MAAKKEKQKRIKKKKHPKDRVMLPPRFGSPTQAAVAILSSRHLFFFLFPHYVCEHGNRTPFPVTISLPTRCSLNYLMGSGSWN